MRTHVWMPLVAAGAVLAGCFTDPSTLAAPDSGTPPTVQLSSTSVSLQVGDSVVLQAKLSNGSDPGTLGSTSWKTSNASVATVDGKGHVRGVAAGNANVTFAAGAASAIASVTVTASSVTPPPPPPPADTAVGDAEPALPQATVDVTMPSVTGRSLPVH